MAPMVVLIPSYEPTDRLLELVRKLSAMPFSGIVVVDDGSGSNYQPIFREASRLGALVLHHQVNLGKGEAMKTGFRFAIECFRGDTVVCADSDGQHLPEDILRVGNAAGSCPGQIALGCRTFGDGTPLRSRFGNQVTRGVFAVASGVDVSDTQTGLRAFSYGLLEWLLQVPGSRFEYEMNMLLEAAERGIRMMQIPIRTVYLDSNRGSHFHPLRDSWRVYKPILKFSAVSLASFGIDFLLLLLLQAATGNLLASVVGARVASATFNFLANRFFVFDGHNRKAADSVVRYAALALGILGANAALMQLTTSLPGMPLVLSKILVEAILFLASYIIQRRFVFHAGATREGRQAVRPQVAGRMGMHHIG